MAQNLAACLKQGEMHGARNMWSYKAVSLVYI